MNANLQLIISKLGLPEDVAIKDFCAALEMEPNINLSGIFTGTGINASTIPWKNTLVDGLDLSEIFFYKIANTSNWNFTYNSFQLDQPEVYLMVESTGATGSEITAMFLCTMPYQGDTIPVMITKLGDSVEFSLYINTSESKYLEFSKLESMFQLSSLKDQYPESFQTLSGLNCKRLTWNYNYSNSSMTLIRISSVSPDWTFGETLTTELTDCELICTIPLPYNIESLIFEVEGNFTLNEQSVPRVKIGLQSPFFSNTHVVMVNGNVSISSFDDITHFFNNVDVKAKLPLNLGIISDLVLDKFVFVYDDEQSSVTSYLVGIKTREDAEWNIIPNVLTLQDLELDFNYSPLECSVKGLLSLGNCDLDVETTFQFGGYDPVQYLKIGMSGQEHEGVSFDLSDLSIFNVVPVNIIPYIDTLSFDLYNLSMEVAIDSTVSLKHLDVTFGTSSGWQFLPGISLESLHSSLSYTFNNTADLVFGSLSGDFVMDGNHIPVNITIPEEGDWTLSLLSSSSNIPPEDNVVPTEIEPDHLIPLSDMTGLISAFGFDFLDNLPTDLLLDGIELTYLNITFPKPASGSGISTASFKTRLTSDWSFTSLLELTDLELHCFMDFTGTETVVDFDIYGKVTIAGVDVSAYVKKREGTWTFAIEDTTLNFSLNDLVGIIPFASGVSFPDFINDITDVSIKINKLEMIYNSDMSELLEFSHSIALDKPWVIAQNILECDELLVENRVWDINTSSSSSEGRIICKVGVGTIDIPVQIPLPFNSQEWTMGIYEPIAIPSLADFAGLSGFNGTAWLGEILGAVIPDLAVSRFDIKFDFDPFDIDKLAFAVSFTDGTSFTLPPGITFSADSVEFQMIKQSGALALDYFALNCSIVKDYTVIPISLKRYSSMWEVKAVVEDNGVIPIHLDMLEYVIPGLSLPSGIGHSGLDIREICLKLTHGLSLIEFYTVMDIKGLGSIVSFGLLKSNIPVKIMYEDNNGDPRYGLQFLSWPFNLGFMHELGGSYLGWILIDLEEFGSIMLELPKFYIENGDIDINGEVKFTHADEVFNLKNGGTINGKGLNIPVKFLCGKAGLSILEPLLPNKIPLAPATTLGDLIEELGGNPDNLPYDCQDYLDISIPDGIQYDIIITSTGDLSLRLSLPDEITGEDKPVAILIPSYPMMFGVKLYNIGFSSIFGNPFFNIDLELDSFYTDILIALSWFNADELDFLIDLKKIGTHFNAKDVWILLSTIIPIPLFYDDISLRCGLPIGLNLETGIKLPRPGLNVADFGKIGAFVVQLKKFFTDADYYLVPQDIGSADLQFSLGPTYAEFPNFMGGPLLGTKNNVFTESATEILCRILNIMKNPSLSRYIMMIPENLRYIDTDIDLGPLHAALKTGFTTVEEFKDGMVSGYPSNILDKLFADVEEGLLTLMYGRWAIAPLMDFEVMLGISLRDFKGGALQVGLHGDIGGDFIGCEITGVTVLNLDNRSNPFIFDLQSKLQLLGTDIATLATRLDSNGFMMEGSVTLIDWAGFKASAELEGSLNRNGEFYLSGDAEVQLAGLDLLDSHAVINNNSITINNKWLGLALNFHSEVSEGKLKLRSTAALPNLGINVQLPALKVHTPFGDYKIGSIHVNCSVSASAEFLISGLSVAAALTVSFTFLKSFSFTMNLPSIPGTLAELQNLIYNEALGRIIDSLLLIPEGWENIIQMLKQGLAVVEDVAHLLVNGFGHALDFAADVLTDMLDYSMEEVVEAFHAIGAAAEDIAKTLRNVFGATDIVIGGVLNGLGCAAGVAGDILTSAFFAVQDVGNVLEAAGYASEAIAEALGSLPCPINTHVCVNY